MSSVERGKVLLDEGEYTRSSHEKLLVNLPFYHSYPCPEGLRIAGTP
jgi:hypothetical protein